MSYTIFKKIIIILLLLLVTVMVVNRIHSNRVKNRTANTNSSYFGTPRNTSTNTNDILPYTTPENPYPYTGNGNLSHTPQSSPTPVPTTVLPQNPTPTTPTPPISPPIPIPITTPTPTPPISPPIPITTPTPTPTPPISPPIPITTPTPTPPISPPIPITTPTPPISPPIPITTPTPTPPISPIPTPTPTTPYVTPGIQQVSITVSGVQRDAVVYIPMSYNTTANKSAVLVFHGGEGGGDKTMNSTTFNEYADTNGFAVVYPNSGVHQWNDGRSETAGFGDDLGFINQLTVYMTKEYGVKSNRFFVTGISNGGLFSQWLACNEPQLFQAFAPVVSNLSVTAKSACHPQVARPMLFFHATTDPFMPYNGGEIRSSARKGVGGAVYSVEDTMAFWSQQLGCSATSIDTPLPNLDPNDGTTAVKRVWPHCSAGTTLEAFKIIGGGHNWTGLPLSNFVKRIVGNPGTEVNSVGEIISFFKQFGL